jgi:uncharacterized protein (TIGR03000 family)
MALRMPTTGVNGTINMPISVPGSNGGMHHHSPNWWRWWWWGRYWMGAYPYLGGYGLGAYGLSYPYSSGTGAYVDSAYYADGSAARAYGSYLEQGNLSSSYYPRFNSSSIPEPADDRAHVTIQSPTDAQVTVQGTILNATGAVRSFDSPPLVPGKRYTYDVEARWREDGKEVSQALSVDVSARSRTELIFRPGAKPLVKGTPGMPAAGSP